MTEKGARRRRSERSHRKLGVSVPEQRVRAVQAEVRAHATPSVSAFISDAVEEKLERDQLQTALDQVWQKKPMTKEERAWVDKILQA